MATEQAQSQYLDATARALEIFASTSDRIGQYQGGQPMITPEQFVQGQLASSRTELAQESTNQKGLNYLRDKECTVAGTDRVITDCIKINGGYFYIDIRNGIVSFVFEINNKRISDGKSFNGKPNSREEIEYVEQLKEQVARMEDFKSARQLGSPSPESQQSIYLPIPERVASVSTITTQFNQPL